MSNDPERPDRPQTAEEAKARFESYLEERDILTPRAGLAAPTGAFIDDLLARYHRYSDHLFACFDDARIPSTSNDLEGFFGVSKQVLRQALGSGSTSNSVVSNLGADALLSFHQMQQLGAMQNLLEVPLSASAFLSARSKLSAREAPMIRQRSMVRYLDRHLSRLNQRWFGKDPPAGVNA